MTVFVLGGAQTDFARNYAREGLSVFEILRDSALAALEATRVPAESVDVAHVGNFAGELFARQGHLGGLFPSVHPAFEGKATSRHEAACASGSVALLAATAEIEAGRYDVACVTGVEQMRNLGGELAASHLGVAAWTGREAEGARFLWPFMFSRVGDVYAERFGLEHAHLAHLAKTAFDRARRNPFAQTRGWKFTDDSFEANDAANPVVEGRIRRQDCAQVTDGSATVILASARFAEAHAKKLGLSVEAIPRILGWGHRTAPMLLEEKITRSAHGGRMFPHVHGVLEDAWKRAGGDIASIDAMEVHDCFTVTAYMILDHLGLYPPGEAWRGIEAGVFDDGGKLPVNPSGGLVGVGHPVGASGVRMVLDAHKQVTSSAGELQVEGARRVQTLNLGGSGTTLVSFVVGNA